MAVDKSFTGRSRKRTTRRGVRLADVAAWLLISVGGIGTIVAVSTVCVVLLAVVVPLFLGARLVAVGQSNLPEQAVPAAELPWHMAVDETGQLGYVLTRAGRIQPFRPGIQLPLTASEPLVSEQKIVAVASQVGDDQLALALSDGNIVVARIAFQTEYLETDQLPADVRSRAESAGGQAIEYQNGVLERTQSNQWRATKLVTELQTPLDLDEADDTPALTIDFLSRDAGSLFCAVLPQEQLRLVSITRKLNPLTRKETLKVNRFEVTYPGSMRGPPWRVFWAGRGDNLYLLWTDGHLVRFDTRLLNQPRLVEELDVLPESTAQLTSAAMLIGRGTLITGDSSGRMQAWFRVRPQDDPNFRPSPQVADAIAQAESQGRVYEELICAHQFDGWGSAVTALAASSRNRSLAAGMADGKVRLVHVTSEKELGQCQAGPGQPVTTVALSPLAVKPPLDGLLVQQEAEVNFWKMDCSHPEITWSSLFFPVWYEGYPAPLHKWESSAAGQDFEPKYGLWPLIHGTIKATVYSMLFGAPLALLAALYTSEFLNPKTKGLIKPGIELMASLPSVVLGFVAALLLAPLIARIVPAVLTAFVAVPTAVMLGAYLFQLLPYKWGLRLAPWRFWLVLPMLLLGLWMALALGPLVERWFFAGDLMLWLDGQQGSGTGGWMLLLLPLCAVGMYWVNREATVVLRRFSGRWPRWWLGLADLLKFVAMLALTVLVTWCLAAWLSVIGWDPRGSLLSTYDQRNALVVGFVMGFAIIPIIYTIAEDALSTVPQHLRSASLGAGATPWQTATRIVIPTAMSGLFSALMIGLGRAVGETMIVLMAAGNTPLMDWNIFNGFRTLSANIAVELPEAVYGSTHSRTLYLAALCLFVLTFGVNTVAEVVRLRFRRRAYEL